MVSHLPPAGKPAHNRPSPPGERKTASDRFLLRCDFRTCGTKAAFLRACHIDLKGSERLHLRPDSRHTCGRRTFPLWALQRGIVDAVVAFFARVDVGRSERKTDWAGKCCRARRAS